MIAEKPRKIKVFQRRASKKGIRFRVFYPKPLYFSTEMRYGINITYISLLIASVGMLIEVLPLKDLDNIVIPVVLGGLAQLQLFAM